MSKYLQNPGFYLMIMWWWFMAFFAIHLLIYPIPVYFYSYVRYFGAAVIIAVFTFALGFLNSKTDFWKRLGIWQKFFVLAGSYVLSVLLVLFNSTLMETYISAKFFDLANDSDFEMMCLPSVVIYFIVGMLFLIIVSIFHKLRQKD